MARLITYTENTPICGPQTARGTAVSSGEEETMQIIKHFMDLIPVFKAFIVGEYVMAGTVYIETWCQENKTFGFDGILERIGE